MYSTCIFCTKPLGHNEALEHFPVGRRLAFDAAKGRLWVICVNCRRWNLTPLEERWEAVEEAERLFRATPLRVSTDHIGLARVADGTDLVRIGEPRRPEFAAWRYGDQFIRRRHKYAVVAGAAAVTGGVAIVGGVAAGVGLLVVPSLWQLAARYIQRGIPILVVARVRDPNGELLRIRVENLDRTTIGIGRDGGLALDIDHAHRMTRFEGAHARRAAAALFPAVNRRGGSSGDVQTAVKRLVHAGSAEEFLSNVVGQSARLTRGIATKADEARYHPSGRPKKEIGLFALPTSLSLAIEMALHEEQERQALEGELAELEDAWREAEEIGAIADDMFLPANIDQVLARLRLR